MYLIPNTGTSETCLCAPFLTRREVEELLLAAMQVKPIQVNERLLHSQQQSKSTYFIDDIFIKFDPISTRWPRARSSINSRDGYQTIPQIHSRKTHTSTVPPEKATPLRPPEMKKTACMAHLENTSRKSPKKLARDEKPKNHKQRHSIGYCTRSTIVSLPVKKTREIKTKQIPPTQEKDRNTKVLTQIDRKR